MIAGVSVPDEDLISELGRARGFRRVEIAAALGDSRGETGPAELRRMLQETGPGTSDLRSAALLALARRCQDEAHDDYVAAFHSRDAATREYAAVALSAYGRDGLWEEVAQRLGETVRRTGRRGTTPSVVIAMIVYLARHASNDSRRLTALVVLIREHWAGLDTDSGDEVTPWIATHWPDAAPSGPNPHEVPAPDTAAMERWIRSDPLFAPLRESGERLSPS